MNFYDVVLDFIFLDAFDDLNNPPGSVVSIIQNRWLSSGFKESVGYIVTSISLCEIQLNLDIMDIPVRESHL